MTNLLCMPRLDLHLPGSTCTLCAGGCAAFEDSYNATVPCAQAPRAKIYRRDEGDAASLAGLQGLMRSNNWQRDSVRRWQTGIDRTLTRTLMQTLALTILT